MNKRWSEWLRFPDPRSGGILSAPIGPGAYEVRKRGTDEYVLIGTGKNVAYRMTSLIPAPLGQGTRNNSAKREYLRENLQDLEYRTIACDSPGEARMIERERMKEQGYLFHT